MNFPYQSINMCILDLRPLKSPSKGVGRGLSSYEYKVEEGDLTNWMSLVPSNFMEELVLIPKPSSQTRTSFHSLAWNNWKHKKDFGKNALI